MFVCGEHGHLPEDKGREIGEKLIMAFAGEAEKLKDELCSSHYAGMIVHATTSILVSAIVNVEVCYGREVALTVLTDQIQTLIDYREMMPPSVRDQLNEASEVVVNDAHLNN